MFLAKTKGKPRETTFLFGDFPIWGKPLFPRVEGAKKGIREDSNEGRRCCDSGRLLLSGTDIRL